MRGLPFHMSMSAILLLVAATRADEGGTQKRAKVQVATASATIIRGERIKSDRVAGEPLKQDRQIRVKNRKPLVEFY